MTIDHSLKRVPWSLNESRAVLRYIKMARVHGLLDVTGHVSDYQSHVVRGGAPKGKENWTHLANIN